jgi:hypothetical protein
VPELDGKLLESLGEAGDGKAEAKSENGAKPKAEGKPKKK